MRAIILVAGRGSRLPKNLSVNPKSYLKIGNQMIIEKLIKNFTESGIKRISLVTGYKNHKFRKFKLKKFYNKKWKESNMVYSLYQADKWLNKYKCIVSYGDILYEKQAVKNLILDKNLISVSYDAGWKKLWKMRFKNPLNDAETFKISKQGNILEIGKKTNNYSNIQGQYMGLIKFEPKGWKIFKKCLKRNFNNYKNLYLTDVFQKLIENNHIVKAIKFNGKWAEVDSKKDYSVMKKIFKT